MASPSAGNMRGDFVYMIVEREFLRLVPTRKAFKIGKSSNLLNRMRQYPKGSQVLTCVHVGNADAAERALLGVFDAIFKRRTDVGREYFAGDPVAMQRLFWSVLDTKGFLTCGHAPDDADADEEEVEDDDDEEEDVVEDDDVMEDVTECDDSSPPSSVDDDVPPPPKTAVTPASIPADADQRVHAFVTAVRGEVEGRTVPLQQLHEQFCVFEGPLRPSVGWKQFAAVLRRNYGARIAPSGSGPVVKFMAAASTSTSTSTVTTTAADKLRAFMAMSDRERGVSIQRVEGHVMWVHDFKAAFKTRMGESLASVDRETMVSFGFSVPEKRHNVCLSCKQLAKGGRQRCCDAYAIDNRAMKHVVFGMAIQ